MPVGRKTYKDSYRGIDYEIRKMRQAKRISLKIGADGQVWISMPHWASIGQAQSFMRENVDFVQQKLDEISKRRESTNGSLDSLTLPVAGEWFKTEIRSSDRTRTVIDRERQMIIVEAPGGVAPEALRTYVIAVWRRRMIEDANRVLPQRTMELAQKVGLGIRRIAVKDQKSRWGSCSAANRSINLNWRCILFPPIAMDYLIFHELAHLRHPNHSKAFWDQVEQWDPGYRASERWITQHGPAIMDITR